MARLSALYPSGAVLFFEGVLRLTDIGGGISPVVESSDVGGRLFVLDPRAAIRDDDTLRAVYNPRWYVERMDPEMRKWMIEHQEWPPDYEPEAEA